MRWAYGVTTCEKRLETLLPATLKSLAAGGFDKPRLFVDGIGDDVGSVRHVLYKYDPSYIGLEVTQRWPAIKTYGNWVLGLWELFLREPDADAYAMFQDDLLMCRNVRQYLEALSESGRMDCAGGYFNLFTWGPIEAALPYAPAGFLEGIVLGNDCPPPPVYHGKTAQKGAGAVALVFSQKAAATLLHSSHTVEHAMNPISGWRSLDGAIVTAMNKAGFREYVHAPSLTQHTGQETSLHGVGLAEEAKGARRRWIARSWPGEEFDAMEYLKC
jgi:hypothetical protein